MPDYPCRYGINCRQRSEADRPCRYVHPDEPQRSQVQNKERRDGPPRSADGQSRSSTVTAATTSTNRTAIPEGLNRWNPSSASKAGGSPDNGGQKHDRNPSSAWNFSGHRAQNSTSSDSGDVRTSTGNQWGDWDSNDKGKTVQNKSSSTTGWGAGDGWGNGGGGWANLSGNSKDSSAENTGGGGWGALSEKADDSSNANSRDRDNNNFGTGWDGAGSNWNFSGGNGRGQPSGDNESRTKDKGKGTDDVRTRTSSPQTKTSFSANSSQQKKALNSDLPRLEPTLPFLQNAPESAGYDPKGSIAIAPPPLGGLPSQLTGTDWSGKLKKEAFEVADLSQDKMKTLKYRGPAGRKTLYTNTVKHLFNAVSYFAELQAVQDDLERWRRTQNSSIYGHATLQTRKVLDSKKSSLTQRLQETKIQFQREVNTLINLPDLGTSPRKRAGNPLTKEVIALYTQELQAWFEDLQLHKRLLVEKADRDDKNEEEGEHSAQGDIEMEEGEIGEQEQKLTVSDLRERVKVTWKELRDVTETLQERFARSQENYYMDIFTCVQDEMESNLSVLGTRLESDKLEEPTQSMDISTISQSVEGTGKKVEEHAVTLAMLLEKAGSLERKLKTLRLERKEGEMLSNLANQYFNGFEQGTEFLKATITEMTEQMKSLYLHKPSSISGGTIITLTMATADSSSASPSSQSEPIDIPNLVEFIRPLVRETLGQEFIPISNVLRQRCMDHHQQLQEKIDIEAGKILDQVQGIRTRFGSNRSVSVAAIPRVQLVTPRVPLPPLTIPTLPPR